MTAPVSARPRWLQRVSRSVVVIAVAFCAIAAVIAVAKGDSAALGYAVAACIVVVLTHAGSPPDASLSLSETLARSIFRTTLYDRLSSVKLRSLGTGQVAY